MGELGTGSLPGSVSIVVTGEGLEWQLLTAEEKLCLLGSIPLQGQAVVSCHGVLDQTRASTTAAHAVPHCSAGVALPEWGVALGPAVPRAVTPLPSPLTWGHGAGRGQHGKDQTSDVGRSFFFFLVVVKIIM